MALDDNPVLDDDINDNLIPQTDVSTDYHLHEQNHVSWHHSVTHNDCVISNSCITTYNGMVTTNIGVVIYLGE